MGILQTILTIFKIGSKGKGVYNAIEGKRRRKHWKKGIKKKRLK